MWCEGGSSNMGGLFVLGLLGLSCCRAGNLAASKIEKSQEKEESRK